MRAGEFEHRCDRCRTQIFVGGSNECERCHQYRVILTAKCIRRGLYKAHLVNSIPRLDDGLEAFQIWTARVNWLTQRAVITILTAYGTHVSDIDLNDCGIVMEMALFGTYCRRCILDMAWVGRVVYDLLH